MEIVVADVKDNVDIFKTGRFLAQFQNYAGPVEVKYVSPYVTQNNKGFMAVPEIGTQVLVCKPVNRNEWYYMGSILEPTVADSKAIGKVKGEGVKDPYTDVYKTRDVVPQKYLFSSPRGNKLVLSDAYSPTEGNFKVMLESSLGMKVELNDSIGALIIRNRTGAAMITITESTGFSEGGGSDSITVECAGNVNITSRNASVDIQVIDGRTLNILNSSTGINRIGQTDPTAGNINITSTYGDVNIQAKGDDQQIRLEATGQSGDIVVNATGTLSMSAAEGVFINSSDGNININGQKIYLN
jgi:hypothetical protein